MKHYIKGAKFIYEFDWYLIIIINNSSIKLKQLNIMYVAYVDNKFQIINISTYHSWNYLVFIFNYIGFTSEKKILFHIYFSIL